MQIAILTFDGFNELDSLVAPAVLNQLHARGWAAYITAPTAQVTSLHGVVIERQRPLGFASEADAVIVCASDRMVGIAGNAGLMGEIRLDPANQLIGAQGSGALLLAALGFANGVAICDDDAAAAWAANAGLDRHDGPFHATSHIATAGGWYAPLYLTAWIILRGGARADAEAAIHHVAPPAERDAWVERAITTVAPFLPPSGIGA
ncbi:hypothetical protein SAMN06295912_10255 [Sphingomonas laterariae]|uniref:DJ-1/PfpI family protein n=1 Tax=Edaphosphingomonas laterariae TaxID=861865 RepID=A0A239C7K8_9SPHN|nr:AraC family transcriptional regulator [Sphingomonas laterariae]SNS16245.1 hypothetical protein SAMN06295912_10255 [Sphingomonas laterariae]